MILSSIVPNALYILMIMARASAVVEIPTTIAVSINTWGSGLEYNVLTSFSIGAVPPITLPMDMNMIKMDVWKILIPIIFFRRLLFAIMM